MTQKKNGDISGFNLLVLITFIAIKPPNKYEPPSPKNILDFGKLKIMKEIIIKI